MTHLGLAARRVIAGGAAGLAVAAIAAVADASWSVAVLYAIDVATGVYAVGVWVTIGGADAAETARLARVEDASRTAAEAVLVGAGVRHGQLRREPARGLAGSRLPRRRGAGP